MTKFKVSHKALYCRKGAAKGVFVRASDDAPPCFLKLCRTFGVLIPLYGPVVAWVVDFNNHPLSKQYEIRKITELTEEEQEVLSAVWDAQGRHSWF